MINIFAVLIVIVLFAASAWPLTRVFTLSDRIERWGLSFLLGTGLTTFFWFVLYLLGLPLSLPTLLLSCCLLLTLGFFLKPNAKVITKNAVKLTKFDWIIVALIVTVLTSLFIIGNYNPITAWDSMALYDSRAHMITLNHSLQDITGSSYYLSYPLYISLLHATVYFVRGLNPQGLHALIFAALLCIIYGRLRAWTTPRLAVLGVALNLFISEFIYHATISYSNLAYTAFLVASFLYTLSARKQSGHSYLVLAGILLGLSTWVRSTEIFWLLDILLIIWVGFRLRIIKTMALSLLFFLIIKQTWGLFYQSQIALLPVKPDALPPIFSLVTFGKVITNLAQILNYLGKNIISPYLGFWGMAVGFGLIAFRLTLPKVRELSVIVFLALLLTIAGTSIYSTFYDTWFAIGDSARRMLLFISPLIMTTAVYTAYKFIPKKYL